MDIAQSALRGLTGLEVAALLGYDTALVVGVAVEPDVVRVAVESAGEVVRQSHPIVEG